MTSAQARHGSPLSSHPAIFRSGARLVRAGDDEWPSRLDDLGDNAPVALWARGAARLSEPAYLDRVPPAPPLTPADPKAAARMDQAMNVSDW